MNENLLSVWWLEDPTAPIRVGVATYISATRVVSFQYDADWIKSGVPLSGDLPLRDQPAISQSGELQGAFADALPDRWGQRVITTIDAPRRATPFDLLYLAGDGRFGALGFSRDLDRYVPRASGPLPQIGSLQALEDLVERVNNRTPLTEAEKQLFHSSRNLGGAHPKSGIQDGQTEWIAKFPRGLDVDSGLIEYASLQLAAECGIRVPPIRTWKLHSGHVLLIERFDRKAGRRIHALSAKTALEKGLDPAYPPEAEASYSAIAAVVRLLVPDPNAARHELFRRMAFNIMIENTDDHERNHAFIHDGEWRLAPAYDVLPTMVNLGSHELLVGDEGPNASLSNALSRCEHFGLNREQAIAEWLKVASVVDQWRARFAAHGVSQADLDYLATFIDDPGRMSLRQPGIENLTPAVTSAPKIPGAARRRTNPPSRPKP